MNFEPTSSAMRDAIRATRDDPSCVICKPRPDSDFVYVAIKAGVAPDLGPTRLCRDFMFMYGGGPNPDRCPGGDTEKYISYFHR